jgi:hypothetical protein
MSLREIHSYVFNKKYVKDAAKEKHELAIKNYAKVLNEKTNQRRTRFTTYGISAVGLTRIAGKNIMPGGGLRSW